MAKRSYNRRSDEQIIADLESRIRDLEAKKEAKQRTDSPVIKEIPRVKRSLAKFSQLCMDHGRTDLANSVMAFLSTLETQARQVPAEARPV